MTGTVDHVAMHAPAAFVWDYGSRRERLERLYEKSKRSQWNATTDVDWDVDVDPGDPPQDGVFSGGEYEPVGPFAEFCDTPERIRLLTAHEHAWMVSQFMHGEQGALNATAKIVACAETVDDKFYAAQQVADEARHVEVYLRYLDKIDMQYPISRPIADLLDDIMAHRHVDMTFLGMQILVEGVALAAFNLGGALFANPLIGDITQRVRADEARHVAFGVLSLSGFYDDMDPVDMAEREEFLLDACAVIRDRFMPSDVWAGLGLDVEACVEFAQAAGETAAFRSLIFSKVVPNLRKLGLLTPRVREGFEKMDILRYERYQDSATEAGELEFEPVELSSGDPLAAFQASLAGLERIAPSAVMQMVPVLVDRSRLADVAPCRIRVNVPDAEEGDWTIVVSGGELATQPTEPGESPDVTVEMDQATWTDLIAGRTNPAEAALAGRISLSGDFEKALVLEAIL